MSKTVLTCREFLQREARGLGPARYRLVQLDLQARVVWIEDRSEQQGGPTITNAADWVTWRVHQDYPQHRIIYRDTAGEWAELKHQGGVFRGYAPVGPELVPTLI